DVLTIAAALAAAASAYRKYRFFDIPASVGDPAHMALGLFVAHLLQANAFHAAWMLSALYVVYQFAHHVVAGQSREAVGKDILTYLAALTSGLGLAAAGLNIPIF
ncbi:MAG: hypothetical protein ACP5MH_11110, partial [Thermoproteus sp.]